MGKISLVIAGAMLLSSCRHEIEARDLDPSLRREARAYLYCHDGPLTAESLSFSRNDARADPYRWASVEVNGCGRAAWCGERDSGGFRCGRTPDLEMATRRLTVETGCPAERIAPAQRVAEVQNGRRGADGSVVLRLDVCGQPYACSVPTTVSDKNDTLLPTVDEGSR